MEPVELIGLLARAACALLLAWGGWLALGHVLREYLNEPAVRREPRPTLPERLQAESGDRLRKAA